MEFQHKMKRIYDHLYANHAYKTPSAIGDEVGKLLHVGMYIEKQLNTKPAFNFDRIAVDELLNGDASIRSKYAKDMKKLFTEMNKAWRLYVTNDHITLGDYDLCYCCTQLSDIEISNKNRDVFGDTIEVFRAEWAKRMGGQFFTDPLVTKLAVNLLGFDPRKGDDLIDMCAGSGGFLLAGLNRIQHLFENSSSKGVEEKEIVRVACQSLKGQEIDAEVCRVANSSLKTRLGVEGSSLVSVGDSLNSKKFKENGHLCAATNPPFGTKITVKNSEILRNFELAKKTQGARELLAPRAPDILFLEQNIRMLVPGKGRLAIVLPYQMFSGPESYYVREWLLANTRLLAVVDLPAETFQPYTGTKTSLLIVERRKITQPKLKDDDDYEVFMSTPRWIGHDRRGHPIFDKKGTDILTDFPQITTAYEHFKKGENPKKYHELSFGVKYHEIANDPLLRINAKFYCPANNSKDGGVMFHKSGWKVVKLKDLVKKIFYPGRFKRNYVDYSPGVVPFCGGANICDFILRTNKWLSSDDPKLDDLKVYAGWILITRSGTTGIISSVPEAWNGYAMSEHVIRIVPDKERIDPEYLLAILQSDYVQKVLAKGVYGSVIDEINPEYVGDINVPIPSSKKEYNHIIATLKEAEKYRQLGILNYTAAVDKVNRLLA